MKWYEPGWNINSDTTWQKTSHQNASNTQHCSLNQHCRRSNSNSQRFPSKISRKSFFFRFSFFIIISDRFIDVLLVWVFSFAPQRPKWLGFLHDARGQLVGGLRRLHGDQGHRLGHHPWHLLAHWLFRLRLEDVFSCDNRCWGNLLFEILKCWNTIRCIKTLL